MMKFKEFIRKQDRIISESEVMQIVGLSKSHIMRLENSNQFPRRIKLAVRRVGWSLKEVEQWLENKKQNRYSNNFNQEV